METYTDDPAGKQFELTLASLFSNSFCFFCTYSIITSFYMFIRLFTHCFYDTMPHHSEPVHEMINVIIKYFNMSTHRHKSRLVPCLLAQAEYEFLVERSPAF